MNSTLIKGSNVQLFTETFGDSTNPAVLLIVGAGAVSNFYPDFFCEELAKHGFFIIRYDQRDYGGSTHFKAIDPNIMDDIDLLKKNLPYRIEDLVDDAKSILDHFNISTANIIGHSLGGRVAQLFTIFYPNYTTSLTSISVAPATNQVILDEIPKETMDILLSNQPTGDFKTDLDGWMRSFKYLNGELSFDEEMAVAYVKTIYNRESFPNVAWNHIAIQNLLQNNDFKFQKNKIPSLILHGEKDVLQPVSYAEKARKLITNSKMKIIPKAGHMFFNKSVWKDILKLLLHHIE
ncbi:MAG: alpha/beta hydrolase [Rickettsiales bacterium]|nr:alpha/beta hydrolase [Rickettsiales bacterium]